MAAAYTVGAYQAGEAQVALRHKYAKPADKTPVIIACHGRSWTALEIQQTVTLMALAGWLVEHGKLGVLSIDAGAGDTWGNAASETALGNAITWVKGANGFADPAKKVVLLGHSMGGLVVLNYAKNHPADVAGVIGGAPATNLARWHADATYGASVDAAYGANYAVNAAGRDPILYAGSFPAIPTRLYSVADDTFIPPAEVQTFHDALPAGNAKSLVALPNGGHQDFWDRIDAPELLRWIKALAY